MRYYVVKYSGPFGFIKPWTAVRDGETFSQQFLTPSIVEGIEKKLFPELLKGNHYGKITRIMRHRLTYQAISRQQEVIQTRGFEFNKSEKRIVRPRSILSRGILINPNVYLAFGKEKEAAIALGQHICLCRNEDILFPDDRMLKLSEQEFNKLDGFELHFEKNKNTFMVGYNRFNKFREMFGRLEVTNNPLHNNINEY
ncbi:MULTISPECIES: hypothetical protein [Niastella]|uniref:Uncharacterized protein n=1 Tax=Niastella soli TaxID=2821487 RepID=A0ABS3YZG3_9BACT|nr:hypothetical protein [Niastella soli]MBO9202526.1 hypothetical protein [Niastella soli]